MARDGLWMTVSAEQLSDFSTLHKARALWAKHELDSALDAFDMALRERPGNLRAILEAARAFGGRHEIARAETLLEKASRLGGDDRRVSPVIAQSYARIFRQQRAIELLEKQEQVPPAIRAELAVLYEQSGRLEDALAAIEACIRDAPSAPEPKLVCGRILRRKGQLQDAETIFSSLAKDDLDVRIQAEAWAELCYIRDAEGDYEAAAQAIGQAHTLVLGLPLTRQLIARARANNAALGRLSERLTRRSIESWRSAAFEPGPRCSGIAHLIGFPRSGTTLLERSLDAHPGLVASPERVVFSRDIFPRLCKAGGGALTVETLNAIPRDTIARERTRYIDYMEAALGEPLSGRVHLDKNPNHTSLLPGLLRLFGESRFIVAQRDPRDVIVSCVLRMFRLTETSAMLLSWETACEMYRFEMETWLRYRDLLDADTWVEVRYEDVVADFEQQARRSLEAVGLSWDERIRDYRTQIIDKHVNSPTHSEVRRPIHTDSIGRWRHYRQHLEPHMHRLEPMIKAFGYD